MCKYLADGLFNGPIVKAYDACHCIVIEGGWVNVHRLDEAHQTFPITVKIIILKTPDARDLWLFLNI